MEKVSINARQLFALIFLFEMGTSLVVQVGFVSDPSVWISILVALFGGILAYLVNDYLFRQYLDLPFSGYVQKILGKYIGWPLSLLYVPLFINIASRNLRETGELLVVSTYDQTPIIAIQALMIITVSYILHKGIEVLARMAEIYLILLIVLGVIGSISVLFSGIIDLKNLLPLVENGWKPIFKDAYPSILVFPYGELITFTAIFPFLNKPQLGRKTGVIALILSGIILSYTHALEIAVLGADIYKRSTFPLFTTISKVNIADFVQRLDVIVILTLIIGLFFKIAIYFYAAVVIASNLFKVQTHKLVFPIGFVIFFTSIILSSSLTEHLERGPFYDIDFWPHLVVTIPVFLLVVHLVRKRFFRSNATTCDKE